MTTSAILLGVMGIIFSFFPGDILAYLNSDTNPISILFLQILSSLYLGFAIMNWMAKGSIIGGIYNKPIAIGNMMHFGVGAIAMLKVIFKIQAHTEIIISLTVIYSMLALSFAYVFMNNPSKLEK
jgi:hypothetical protein